MDYRYKYKYNNNQYILKFSEIGGPERFKFMILKNIKIFDIIVYVFDLSKDDDIVKNLLIRLMLMNIIMVMRKLSI